MKRTQLWIVVLVALFATACADKQPPTKGKEPSTTREGGAEEPKAEEPSTTREGGAEEPSTTREGGAEEPSTTREGGAEEPKAPGFDLAGTLLGVEKFIPDSPVIVAAGDVATLQQLILDTFGGSDLFLLPEDQLKALQETLSKYHLEKLGFTVQTVESVVGFVGPTGDGGALIKGQAQFAEELYGETIQGFRTLKLIPDPKVRLFEIPDYGVGIYVAAAVKFDTYLQIVAERTAPKPDRLKTFTDLLGSSSKAWFGVAVNFAHPIVAAAWPPDVPFKRPDKGLIQFTTDGFIVEIEAQPEVLESIEALIAMGRTQGRAALDQAKAQLDHMPVAEGTAILVADAYYNVLFERLAPKRDGDKMRMEMTLALWGATPIIGILAAVAIPAFIKYQKKSKASEAHYNLDKIRSAAEAYFCADRVDQEGNLLPKQFPPSVGKTPATGCCASFGGPDSDGDDACDPDESRFSGETWQALNFAIPDKHWFTYAFESNGKTGNEAEFKAIALGDLDCDGIPARFEASGKGSIADDGSCTVELMPLYIENELE